MALTLAMETRGFDLSGSVTSINQAITDGVFGQTAVGGLFLRTPLEQEK